MHHHRCFLLLLGVFISAVAPSAPAAPSKSGQSEPASSIKEAVLAANTAMIAAANRLDLDTFFASILDGDTPPVVQNGAIFATRREARDAVERALRGITKIDRRIDNPQVTVLGPDAALLVGDGIVTGTADDGRTMASRFAVSLVFVRREGRWMLLHGHYSVPPRM